MKCTNCGTEYEEGIFCPECGTKVENRVTQQALNDKVDEKEVKEKVGEEKKLEEKILEEKKSEEKKLKKKNTPEAKAKKALIFGIITWVLAFTAILSMLAPVTSIIGIVYGVKGIHSEKKGMAIAGIIVNALWWVLLLVGILILVI